MAGAGAGEHGLAGIIDEGTCFGAVGPEYADSERLISAR